MVPFFRESTKKRHESRVQIELDFRCSTKDCVRDHRTYAKSIVILISLRLRVYDSTFVRMESIIGCL